MAAGIPIDTDRVMWFSTEDMSTLFADAGWAMRHLQGCSAVLCYNDQVAADLLAMLAQQGIRVPDDISVMGVDNFALAAYCDPPLTTVNHPKEQLGRTVAENLLRHMDDPAYMPGLTIEPKLVERKSVRVLGTSVQRPKEPT